MKQIVFDEKTIEFLNGEKEKALDDIAVTIVYKDTLEQKDKEIERLNNIINELEKWFKDMNIEKLATFDDYDMGQYNAYKKVINKLQELKGSDKE